MPGLSEASVFAALALEHGLQAITLNDDLEDFSVSHLYYYCTMRGGLTFVQALSVQLKKVPPLG